MKQIQLTKTTQIPDENHEGEGEPASATNYAGSVVDVSDEVAAKLIAAGHAIEHVPVADEPAGATAAAVEQHFTQPE